jgi:glycosyltransferase involved in cell wall biosynthesis
MKLIYLTSKRFPASTADHFFAMEMAKSFTKQLGDNFLFIVANAETSDLPDISFNSLSLKVGRGVSLSYFLRLPMIVKRKHLSDIGTFFYSNDPNLLSILIFWKKALRLKYQVVSEWHMLFGGWRDRFVSQNSAKLISTTKHLKGLISERCEVEAAKILPVYGGVNIENFDDVMDSNAALRNRLHLPLDSYLVGYVGFYKTMGMAKGLDTMIKALKSIPDKNIKMVFVGGKADEIAEYSLLAKDAGVGDRAIFIGMVPMKDIPAFTKAMDILVIPYPNKPHYRDYGFPMKVYEYMASRKPIIYSDLPIIREVLGDCATSFEPDNENDLAAKIIDCRADSVKVEGLVGKAYDKVKGCTWEKRAQNIISFLKGI